MNNSNNQKMKTESHNLFSTPIWGYVLSSEKNRLDSYIKRIRTIEEHEPSVKKSNFGGYQTRDSLHIEPIFQELVETIESLAQDIVEDIKTPTEKVGKVVIKDMWANINNKYNCNQAHVHSGILSGAFYLQVPENSGKIVFVNPAVRSSAHLIRSLDYGAQPAQLCLFLFPSWLEHYVESNMNDESRISISFNIDLGEK